MAHLSNAGRGGGCQKREDSPQVAPCLGSGALVGPRGPRRKLGIIGRHGRRTVRGGLPDRGEVLLGKVASQTIYKLGTDMWALHLGPQCFSLCLGLQLCPPFAEFELAAGVVVRSPSPRQRGLHARRPASSAHVRHAKKAHCIAATLGCAHCRPSGRACWPAPHLVWDQPTWPCQRCGAMSTAKKCITSPVPLPGSSAGA